MHWIYFLGRFHVLAVHLPLGILTLAIVFEVLVRFPRFRALEPSLGPIWAAGALSAIGTVILGFMHASESGFAGSPGVEAHRLSGLLLTFAACLAAALRLYMGGVASAKSAALGRFSTRAWPVAVGATALLLISTGHLGGSLTHGETYLAEYAPEPIRRLAGVKDAVRRPRPKDFASADIYLDVVAPALSQRCGTCHNDSKRSGGLSMASYDTLMRGGKDGPVVAPGDAGKSDLFRRISLPQDHKEFMPKDGKTPLTEEQIAAVRIWIAQGAPKSARMATLNLAKGEPVLRHLLGFGGVPLQTVTVAKAPGSDENDNLPVVSAAPASLLVELESAGFVVRPIAKGSNLLDVDFTALQPVSSQQMQLLSRIAPQVIRLNLRKAGIDDANLSIVASMTNLRRLRLEDNSIDDQGAKRLAEMKELRYLNLHGTRVSDAGVQPLGDLPHLREIYLWGSAVTPRGLEALHSRNARLLVNEGRPEFIPPTPEPATHLG